MLCLFDIVLGVAYLSSIALSDLYLSDVRRDVLCLSDITHVALYLCDLLLFSFVLISFVHVVTNNPFVKRTQT